MRENAVLAATPAGVPAVGGAGGGTTTCVADSAVAVRTASLGDDAASLSTRSVADFAPTVCGAKRTFASQLAPIASVVPAQPPPARSKSAPSSPMSATLEIAAGAPPLFVTVNVRREPTVETVSLPRSADAPPIASELRPKRASMPARSCVAAS